MKPSDYIKRNFAITTSGAESHNALGYSINTIGASNIMWAIDYPYEPSKPAVEFLESAQISQTEKEMIFGLNALRLFHIER